MKRAVKELIAKVEGHIQAKTPMAIRGQGSKLFYGNDEQGELISTDALTGIVDYDPSELVVTAKAGTPLKVLQAALDEQNQRLAFEPPTFDGNGTVGGMIATGLAGARRPWSGGARDYVLGLHLINGKAEYCRFDGQVMKNVAGYDVSRLMVGAMGCLGLMTQVSLKVLPKPQCVECIELDLPLQDFVGQVKPWMEKMTPVTGLCHDGRKGYVRLEGFGKTVETFAREQGLKLAGEPAFWEAMANQGHEIFQTQDPLWRLSLPKWTVLDGLELPFLMDWAGAQYWIRGGERKLLDDFASEYGGHLAAYKNIHDDAFSPLSSGAMMLHKNLKRAFDPKGLFNPGRLFKGL